jgi:hypothetical protein
MNQNENTRKRKRKDDDSFMNEISKILLETNNTAEPTSDIMKLYKDVFLEEDDGLSFESPELFSALPDYATEDDEILDRIKLTIPIKEADVSQTRKCPYCNYYILETEDDAKLINHIVDHLNKLTNTFEYKPKAVNDVDKIKADPGVIVPLRNTASFEKRWQESFSTLKEYMSDESNLPEKLSQKYKRWFREQIDNYENNMNTMNNEKYPMRRSDWEDFMKSKSYENLMKSKNRKWR